MMYGRCKICNSSNIEDYFNGDERIKKCRNCGVGFLVPDLINYNPADYYKEASNYTSLLGDQKRSDKIRGDAKAQLRIIRKFVGSGTKILLDVGAHTGLFVQGANSLGFKAYGIEPNKFAADWADKHGIPVKEATIESYSPGVKYDVITIFHVLEHINDPIPALNKINDLLQKNGYLVIEVPNSDSYLAKLDGVSWKFIALEHLFYFSEKSLRKILEDMKFSIIKTRKRNYEINYLNIRKLLHYIYGGKLNRDRLTGKKNENFIEGNIQKDNLVKMFARKLLILLIYLLGREDHILIIAYKK